MIKRTAGAMVSGLLLIILLSIIGLIIFKYYIDSNNKNTVNEMMNTKHIVDINIEQTNSMEDNSVGINNLKTKLNQFSVYNTAVTYGERTIFSGDNYVGVELSGTNGIVETLYNDKLPTLNIVVEDDIGFYLPKFLGDSLLDGNLDNYKLGGIGTWYFVFSGTKLPAKWQGLYEQGISHFEMIEGKYLYNENTNSWDIPAIVLKVIN